MNYIVVNSVCCCLSVCCKQFWESIYKIIGKQAFVKVAYCLIYYGSVFVAILLASIMDNSWSFIMTSFAPGIDCKQKSGQENVNCLTSSAVYRISLSLFLFSIFMLIVLKLCSSRIALIINQGLFFSKFVIIMITFALFLRVDNQFFMKYGQLCKIVSLIFVVVQQIILVDLAYLWGIRWAKHYSDGNQLYAWLLIISSVVMFGGSLGFVIAGFQGHVKEVRWLDIVCVVQLLIMVGVQLLNFNKQNSLLTTSSLCLLVSYYTWVAGWSYPQQTTTNLSQTNTILLINIGVSILLLIFSTAGSIYGSTNKRQEDNHLIDLDNLNVNDQQLQLQAAEQNKWLQWVMFMTGMSAYVAMIFTDWGSSDIVKKEFNLTDSAWNSKSIMGTTVCVMYTWTLLAPRLCPNRNFYFQ